MARTINPKLAKAILWLRVLFIAIFLAALGIMLYTTIKFNAGLIPQYNLVGIAIVFNAALAFRFSKRNATPLNTCGIIFTTLGDVLVFGLTLFITLFSVLFVPQNPDCDVPRCYEEGPDGKMVCERAGCPGDEGYFMWMFSYVLLAVSGLHGLMAIVDISLCCLRK